MKNIFITGSVPVSAWSIPSSVAKVMRRVRTIGSVPSRSCQRKVSSHHRQSIHRVVRCNFCLIGT